MKRCDCRYSRSNWDWLCCCCDCCCWCWCCDWSCRLVLFCCCCAKNLSVYTKTNRLLTTTFWGTYQADSNFFFFLDSRVGFYSWAQENASYPISLKKCHVGVQSFPCSTVCLVPELVLVRRLKKGLFFRKSSFWYDFLVQLRNTLSYRLDGSRFLVPNLNPWIQKTNWISLVHIEG